MKDFPSCFGENGVQVADSSSSNSNPSKNAQNLATCLYQCKIRGKSYLITVTWSKNLMGHGLTVTIDDSSSNHCLCKVDIIKPWLFSKRKGSKSSEAYSSKIDVYWDFSSVKFICGPEPLEGFYVAAVVDKQIVLLLGDMRKEAIKKTNAVPARSNAAFISKREHLFGKKTFFTKAKFCDGGEIHDLVIDCETINVNEPCLSIRVDGKTVLQVKRLRWKFRGNVSILVDGMQVEVLWDVYNWLFASSLGNTVFMFKTEKLVSSSITDPNALSLSFSQRFVDDSKSRNFGFSLILYAWKNE